MKMSAVRRTFRIEKPKKKAGLKSRLYVPTLLACWPAGLPV